MDSVSRTDLMNFRKNHAVIIGIDDYHRSVGKLSTPIADARRFQQILLQKQGFEQEDVHLLTDPTKEEIETLLSRLATSGSTAAPSSDADEAFDIRVADCIVFYFAGHGLAGDLPEEGEEKGPAGYLLPKDASLQTAKLSENDTLIKMEQVFTALENLDAHHTLLILDCCFAGSFRRVNQSRGDSGLSNRPMTQTRFERYKTKKAWQVIASSGPAEKAADWIGERGDDSSDRKGKLRAMHSPFAMALFEALEGRGDVKPLGKGLGDGVITASELFLYLHDQVERITRKDKGFKPQNPSLFPLGNDDGGQFIFIDPRHPRNDPDWATLRRSNPYKGLEQFDIADTPYYYGREKELEKVLEAIKFEQEEKGPPILMVTGSSGSGKSSFIKAGVLSKFEALETGEGDEKRKSYELFQLRPGNKPWTITKYEDGEWKPAFAPATDLVDLPDGRRPTLLGHDSPLDFTAKQILLIDQYEELFTACSEAERVALETALITLLNQALTEDGQLQLFITIRSDFEWRLEVSSLGQAYWNERNTYYHLCRLHALGLDQLRDVLINPALVLAYDFEEKDQTSLVDVILDDLDYLPSALPLLSYCMKLLADKTSKAKRTFLIDTYMDDIGGVAGAMQKRLDDIYQELTPVERSLMRQIILRMVNLSDGEYTRRRLFRAAELDELQFSSISEEQVNNLVEKLVDAQLIYIDEMADIPFVELVHDSLINTGSTCRLWIQDFGRENLVLQRQLWEAVQEFKRKGEDIDFLWDDNPKIGMLNAIQDSGSNWFNAAEIDFVQKSWTRKEEEIIRVRKQRDEAWATALAARAQQYSFEDVTHGLRIAEGAYNWTPTPLLPAQQSLVRTYNQAQGVGQYTAILSGHQGQVWSMAIAEDRQIFATGGQDGKIFLWRTSDQGLILEIDNDEGNSNGFPGPIRALSFYCDVDDGSAIAIVSGNDRGIVRKWRVSDGFLESKKQLGSFFSSIWTVDISHNGQFIAAGGGNGTAVVWKPNDTNWQLKVVHFPSTMLIYGLAFIDDDRDLVVAASEQKGMVKRFQLEPFEESWSAEVEPGFNTASFLLDGKAMLTGGLDREGQLWDLEDIAQTPMENHQPLQRYVGHTDTINTIGFSKDQRMVLTGSSDQTAILWDRETGDEVQRFQVPNSSVLAAVLALDQSFMMTAGHDGLCRIWNASPKKNLLTGHLQPIEGMSVSLNAEKILTYGHFFNGLEGRMLRELKIWDLSSGLIVQDFDDKQMGLFFHRAQHYLTIDPAGLVEKWDQQNQLIGSFSVEPAISMAISHDDQWLLIGTERGKAIIYNIATGEPTQEPFSNGSSRLAVVAFSRDDKSFVAGQRDALGASLWNIEDRSFIQLQGHTNHVMAAAFAKDGEHLLTGSWDNTVRVWDAKTGEPINTFDTGKLISAVAISDDSQYFLTTRWDDSVVLRSLATGDVIGNYQGHKSFITGLAFGPEDRRIFSVAKDRVLRIWLTPAGIQENLREASLYELSEEEKTAYGLNQSFD